MRNIFSILAAALCTAALALALAGCGGTSPDVKNIQGVWQVENTEVTVVFTDTEFKMVGNTYNYTLDTGSKTIHYTSDDTDQGDSSYEISEDGKTLTIKQPNPDTGETQTTVFDKVSDDTSQEPSANGVEDDE